MSHIALQLPLEKLAEFCRRHQIRRLALFGSALRDDFHSESDLDLLAEFEPEARISLLTMASLQRELTEMLGRTVDLRTPAELSRYFRKDVLQHCEVLYAKPGPDSAQAHD